MMRQRGFDSGQPLESRVHCACDLCRLRWSSRMFIPWRAIRAGTLVVLKARPNALAIVPTINTDGRRFAARD